MQNLILKKDNSIIKTFNLLENQISCRITPCEFPMNDKTKIEGQENEDLYHKIIVIDEGASLVPTVMFFCFLRGPDPTFRHFLIYLVLLKN